MLRNVLFCVSVIILAASATTAGARELQFFKIASGAVGGTYYPIAGMISQIISNPPGSKSCESGGNCGVPGLAATATASGGSVANVEILRAKQAPSAIAQSDVAYWAQTGTGPFRTRPPISDICAITALYPEEVHLVAAKNTNIDAVYALKGHKVALGKADSGALLGAQLIVRAFGLSEGRDFAPAFVDYQQAADMVKKGTIDAFVTVSGHPNKSIAEMIQTVGARLVPIDGSGRDKLVSSTTFYTSAEIPSGSYPGQNGGVQTVAVPALWLARTDLDQDLLYRITKAFWSNPKARGILESGHPKGEAITQDTALAGVSVPLCDGAAKFYKESGLLK